MTRGWFDDAVVTVDAITSRDGAVAALSGLGESAFAPLSLHEQLRFVARLAHAEVRATVTARIVAQTLRRPDLSDADRAWATRVVDSLPPGSARNEVIFGLVSHSLGRRDFAAARARLLPMLGSPGWPASQVEPYDYKYDALVHSLVSAGALEETVVWARALRLPVDRAAALLEIGRAIEATARVGQLYRLRNGPDNCRYEF